MRFSLLLVVGFLQSCVSVYDIAVDKKGAAHVDLQVKLVTEDGSFDEMRPDEIDEAKQELDSIYNSPVISNNQYEFTDESIDISFDISTIDSLGSYISPLYPYPVSFTFNSESLVINGSDGELDPDTALGMYANFIQLEILFHFKKKIKAVECSDNLDIEIQKKSIKLKTTLGNMDFSGKQNSLTIMF
jgi:hypothetical protein